MLALDLGGTQIRAAVVLADGTRLARAALPTPSADGPEAIVASCIDALRKARSAAPAAVEADLAGVGLSSPGPVDPARGVVTEPPNLGPGFRDISLAAAVQGALGLPAFLDRDTNVAALGERAYGAGRDCDDFIYLTISTGVGGGIIAGGQLFHGPDGLAGELGHVPVDADGPICGCGGRGHLGTALARDARAAAADGSSPFLAARAQAGTPLSAKDVADGEAADDPVCVALLARARRAVGIACVGFVNAFNPHRIIIGGSIAEAQRDRLLELVRETIRSEAFRGAASRVVVLAPELGPDVSLAGAHPLVMSRLGDRLGGPDPRQSPAARGRATPPIPTPSA